MPQQSPTRRQFVSRGAALAVVTLATSACSFEAEYGGSGEYETLKVTTIGLTSDGALINGIEKGFFEDEGLQIETSLIKDPSAGLAAAQSGQVDVTYSPSISVLNAMSRGMPITVVAAADGFSQENVASGNPEDFDDTALIAAPDSGIKSLEELEGKTIAVPARKAQLEIVVTKALAEAGVDPDNVEWVVLDFTSAVTALKSGQVDAAGLVSPFSTQAEADGGQLLASPSIEFFGPRAVGLWTVGNGNIARKPKVINGFERAIVRSNRYANDNPDEAIRAGLEYTKSSLTLDQVKQPYWPESVNTDDLEMVNEALVNQGVIEAPVDLTNAVRTGETK